MRFLLLTLLSAQCVDASSFYVATNGTAGGSGSIASPWSLESALTNPPTLLGGDTVFLRGGTYSNLFSANLFIATASNAPIIFKPYLAERPIIQGQLDLNASSNVWFWGLEITDPGKTNRANPFDTVREGEQNTKFINCLIHDCCIGLGNGPKEAYGNIIWNAGKHSLEHGIYWQNDTPNQQVIQHNLIGFSSGWAIHCFSSSGVLTNQLIDGNAMWYSGTPNNDPKGHLLLGGGTPLINDILTNNHMLYSQRGIDLGFSVDNTNVLVSGNFAYTGFPLFYRQQFQSVTLTNNYLHSTDHSPIWLDVTNLAFGPHAWNRNDYRSDAGGWADNFVFYNSHYTNFAAWKTANSVDANSTYTNVARTTNLVQVLTNRYEYKRANVLIWNWGNSNNVPIDLSSIANNGDTYVVRNAQDWFGPAWTGTYSGPVSLPMTNLSVAQQLYWDGAVDNVSTAPLFAAFVATATTDNSHGKRAKSYHPRVGFTNSL